MKKFMINPISGEKTEIEPNVYKAKFEHIATGYPEEVKLTEEEFKLMTAKKDRDINFDKALFSLHARGELTSYGNIEEFFEHFFFEGVYMNNKLRSH
jgi:hypothetical protein|tara:strand:+ start:3797 stop:4087 length:291 start_codon:yes stop_codon:yes gene_type:complete